MKKLTFLLGAVAVLSFSACNKCHECHYDLNGSEVELGEYCGQELKDLESNGYADATGTVHTVHCGEDH